MTAREIQAHLEEIYGVEVSPTLISSVTDAVLDEVKAWQSRPLDAVYPIVYLDAIMVKVRDGGHVSNRAVYLAIGVTMAGIKEVLGLWIAQTEGAKFWLQVVTELKNRGVCDIFIACVDGLKGFPEAIEAVFPKTEIQLCIVHLVRHSLNFVSWKQRKEVAGDLKTIYQSATVEQAGAALDRFADKWDDSHPGISKSWRRNWERVIPFFAYPADIRKVIYTTNTIESLNMSLRKVTKTGGHFQATRRRPSSYILRCAISAKGGQCRSGIGKPPSTGLSSCLKDGFSWTEPDRHLHRIRDRPSCGVTGVVITSTTPAFPRSAFYPGYPPIPVR
jgi:putative transposase